MSDDRLHDSLRSTPDPVVVPFDARHVDPSRELWRTRFGGTETHTENWLHDAQVDVDRPTQGYAAVDGGRLAGFGIATIGGPDYIEDYVGVAVDVEPWSTTGVLHILVVASDYEGQGVGSQLVAHRLRWLDSVANAEGAIGVSWHRENYRDSRPLFEKFGFSAVATVDEYYARLDGPCPCVDCESSCRCDATIYRRAFPAGGDSG